MTLGDKMEIVNIFLADKHQGFICFFFYNYPTILEYLNLLNSNEEIYSYLTQIKYEYISNSCVSWEYFRKMTFYESLEFQNFCLKNHYFIMEKLNQRYPCVLIIKHLKSIIT